MTATATDCIQLPVRRGWWRALLDPACPPALVDEMAVRQFERARELIPVLYLTIAVIAIAAGVAARSNLPSAFQFLIPSAFISLSIFRYFSWRGKRFLAVTPTLARTHLRSILAATIPMSLSGAALAVVGFYLAEPDTRALPPMFITLAAYACASCVSSYPRAAILTLFLALGPIILVMLTSGDHAIAGVGITIAVVCGLQVRFIHARYQEALTNLILQRDMRILAETDSLTGLQNRRAFTGQLEACLSKGDADRIFAVAMIDLDGFKPANDRYGHATGDALLIEVSRRLQAICATAECVARIGGDEFAILFETVADETSYADRAAAIRSVLSLPYAVDDLLISLSASVGLSTYPRDGKTVESLLKSADRALYAEKAKLYEEPADEGESRQISLFG